MEDKLRFDWLTEFLDVRQVYNNMLIAWTGLNHAGSDSAFAIIYCATGNPVSILFDTAAEANAALFEAYGGAL